MTFFIRVQGEVGIQKMSQLMIDQQCSRILRRKVEGQLGEF